MDNNQMNQQKRKKTLLILAVCGILVLAVGVVIFARPQNNDSKTTELNENQFVDNQSIEKDKNQLDDSQSIESTEQISNTQSENDTPIDEYVFTPSNPTEDLYSIEKDDISFDESQNVYFINNILIVGFTDDATDSDKKELMNKYGKSVGGQSDILNEVYLRVDKKDYEELTELCSRIEEESIVDFAWLDLADELSYMDYDIPKGEWEEGKDNNDQVVWDESNPDGSNYYMEVIDARGAWQYANELEPITVGIMDEELYVDHPDLKGRVRCLYAEDAYTDTSVYTSAHGTHVVGVICANSENTIGIDGIARNADCVFVSAKHNNEGWEKIVEDYNLSATNVGIMNHVKHLIENGARVINLSWGLKSTLSEKRKNAMAKYYSRAMSKLLDKGYDFVIVQSAGNQGIDADNNGFFSCINEENCYDKRLDVLERIIIVGATEEEKTGNAYKVCAFSNGGDRVDICAPGANIYSTFHPYEELDNETGEFYSYGYYEHLWGTSMATPQVVGICALVWGTNLNYTGAEVKSIVCDPNNTVYDAIDNPESVNTSGQYRIVNAKLAVETALIKAGKEDLIVRDDAWKEVYLEQMANDKAEYITDEVISWFGMGDTTGDSLVDGYLYDFNYDGVPELISNYMDGPGYGPWCQYTYVNGELKMLEERPVNYIRNVRVGDGCMVSNSYCGQDVGCDVEFKIIKMSQDNWYADAIYHVNCYWQDVPIITVTKDGESREITFDEMQLDLSMLGIVVTQNAQVLEGDAVLGDMPVYSYEFDYSASGFVEPQWMNYTELAEYIRNY